MPTVNYVREHERFIEFAADEELTFSDRCLWYALMHIFNQRANGNDWPGGFIPVKNSRLFTYFPGGFDTLVRSRNRLKQKGLIDCRAGNRNKAAPEYRMHYLCADDCPNFADKNGCYPQNTDNIQDNMRDNIRGNIKDNMWDNITDNIGDQYINQNMEYTETPVEEDDNENDEENNRARGDGITGGFYAAFGRMPYPAEVSRLNSYRLRRGFSAEMVCRALEIAAGNGAARPVEYTLTVLEDWRTEGVMQPHQVDEYQVERDILTGRNLAAGTGDSHEDWQRREEARKRRMEENRDAGIG